ncbi:hypothetical protein DYY65_07775 [Nitrososphaera sp. AFS]|nr:hypothetical protein [Nitrososphaera sp. AFS]
MKPKQQQLASVEPEYLNHLSDINDPNLLDKIIKYLENTREVREVRIMQSHNNKKHWVLNV